MFSALIYLQVHSIANRLFRQARRLRQPKYLLFAVIGGLYFYYYFFRYAFRMRGGSAAGVRAITPGDLALYEALGALTLLVLVFFAWILPHQRAALAFTEAEVAFLFPAPITRRGLIHFKLIRSQTAILFTTLILTLVSNRFGGRVWFHAAGWWLILSNLNLHFLGSSFARTMLLDRGITNWQRRLWIFGIALLVLGVVVVWVWRTVPPPEPGQLNDLENLKQYVRGILVGGPTSIFLYPFRVVVRPYLAPDVHAFVWAAPGALALMLIQYLWVVRANVAFEEASVEASRKIAEKLASVRSGKWQGRNSYSKAKRPPFVLHPLGPRAIGLLWKNLISVGHGFTVRFWIVLAATAGGASIGLGQTFGRAGWVPAMGMVAAVLIVWSVILGPQFLRHDFRQDLPLADILKMYPLPGWQIALGELLAPVSILTAIQWCLLLVGAGLLSQSREVFGNPPVVPIALGAGLILPMLNLITLQIPNAAILLLPTWFQTSRGGPQGIEATGQRLIFLFGQLLAFLVVLVPAACFFVGSLLFLKLFIAVTVAIPLAALVASVVLSVEAGLGLLFLGWLFERLDLSAEMAA